MKKLFTKITLVLLLLCGFVTVFGGQKAFASAKSSSKEVTTYYDQLGYKSMVIYDAISEMHSGGLLKENGEKEVSDAVSRGSIKDYQSGDNSLLKYFAYARDAYYLDHPELFYIDFDNLSIGMYLKDGEYLAYINSGRTGSYYIDGGFTTKSSIETAENALNNVVTNYVSQINASVDAGEKDEKVIFESKVRKANELLSTKVSYSFEASNQVTAPHIRTAYGALVNERAVCEGFARAFKLLMDKVGIDCQVVIGYYKNGDNYEPHAWNLVRFKKQWYLVDSTFNSNASDKNTYTLLGAESTDNYVEDVVVSSTDIKFSAPTLATFNFGMDEVITSVETKKNNGVPYQIVNYSYDDKNAEELEKDGLYVVIRHHHVNGSEYKWTDIYAVYKLYPKFFTFTDKIYDVQFFVVTEAPTTDQDYGKYDKTLDQLSKEGKVVAQSAVVVNDFYNENSIIPLARKITPNNSGRYNAEEPLEISVVYDMDLSKVDETKDVKINVTTIKYGDMSACTKVENVVFNKRENEISFKFTPSLYYAHDALTYYFKIENVGATLNSTAPHPVSFNFQRKWSVCSKVYDGGRLYMNVFGEPVLIDNKDLSVVNFQDEKGNFYAESQRSQLVLVASKATEQISGAMEDAVKDILNVEKLVTSATYELDLHICGTVAKIPSGSYLRLAFGFPEGFSKDNAGVTFKVYHYKKDADGDIIPSETEEIPCVVTEYGIVAIVNSFSPFAIVGVKTEDLPATENAPKSIYSYVTAGNGSIFSTIDGVGTDAIASVESGKKITYTFLPGANEKIDYVLLNQTIVEVTDDTVEIDYEDLSDNSVLQVAFVDKDVAKRETESGLVNLNVTFAQNEKVNYSLHVSNVFTIRLIIAMIVVLIAIGVVGLITIKLQNKKKKAYLDAQNGDKNKNEKEKK